MCLKTLKEFRKEVVENGIRCHGPTMAKIGDEIECLKGITTKTGDDIKGKVFKVIGFDINSLEGGGLGFSRRIKIGGFPEESFNPNKFRKV